MPLAHAGLSQLEDIIVPVDRITLVVEPITREHAQKISGGLSVIRPNGSLYN